MKTFAMTYGCRLLFAVIGICAVRTSAVAETGVADRLGKWVLIDAGCSNPNYVPGPEETAFIDALHHKGDTWTDDAVEFKTQDSGEWVTIFTSIGFDSTVLACRQTQRFTTATSNGGVLFHFTEGSSAIITPGTNPNVTMTCPPAAATDEHWQKILITTSGLEMISTSSVECGDFRFQFKKAP